MESRMSTFRVDRELPTRPQPPTDHPHADPAELQVLLSDETFPRLCIRSADSGVPSCKTVSNDSPILGYKQYSTLEGSSFERGLKLKLSDYGASSEMSSMIRRLQNEVDTLRVYMDERRKEHDSCIYERIETKNTDRSDYKRRQQTLRSAFVYHASNRGLYRLRHLLDHEASFCMKLVWLVLFICLSALLVYQVRDRVLLFMTFNSDTRIDIIHGNHLDFPSVTICNLNTYRCRWQGRECGVANFSRVITDRGVCYTFTPSPHIRPIAKPGPSNGLSLLLNVEQYEYLLGPRSAVGVGVAVHERGDVPRMTVDGMYAATGVQTSIAVHHTKVVNTPATFGGCSEETGSTTRKRRECSYECEVARVIEHCGCLLPYRVKSYKGNARPCRLSEYFFCAKSFKGRSAAQNCSCKQPCMAVKYEVELSQSTMSSYAADSEARLLLDRGVLHRHFQKARDTYHRYDPDIFDYDVKLLDVIYTGFCAILANLKKFSDSIPTDVGQKYGDIMKALADIDDIVKGSSNLIRQHHVAFIPFSDDIAKDLEGIIFSRKSSQTEQRDPDKMRIEIRSFTNILSGIIDTKLKAVLKGVKYLQGEVVQGYGQKYMEFRQSITQYNQTITTLYNYINTINKTLLSEYKELVYILDSPWNQRRSDNALKKFFNSMSSLIQNSVTKMKNSLSGLFGMYAKQTSNIKKLDQDLTNVFKQFNKAKSVNEISLMRLYRSVHELKYQVNIICEIMKVLRDGYKKKAYLKTNIGEEFEKSGMASTIERAINLFDKIEHDVDTVSLSGRKLYTAIQPIASRIVQMTKITYSDLQAKLDALRYSSLAVEVKKLSEDFNVNLTSVTMLQTEVKEYLDANKIDGTFYQNNFLQLEVYYHDLSVTSVSRHPAYGIVDLACDVGGSLALYLGASLFTVFEIIDFLCKALHLVATGSHKL